MRQHRKLAAGFTLVELMVVVAIVGILAGIAYPSYMEYVRSSRRAEGQQALLRIQLEQEKVRANEAQYTNDLNKLGFKTNKSSEGNYTLSVTVSVTGNTATGYTATAVPGHSDPTCNSLTLTIDPVNGEVRGPTGCWKK